MKTKPQVKPKGSVETKAQRRKSNKEMGTDAKRAAKTKLPDRKRPN